MIFSIIFKKFNNCFLDIILLVPHQDEVGKCVQESHQQVCKTYVNQKIVGRVPHASMTYKEYGKNSVTCNNELQGIETKGVVN